MYVEHFNTERIQVWNSKITGAEIRRNFPGQFKRHLRIKKIVLQGIINKWQLFGITGHSVLTLMGLLKTGPILYGFKNLCIIFARILI